MRRTITPLDLAARHMAEQAEAAAAAADGKAANARQMVINRDLTLASLSETAATAEAAILTSAEDRALLHQQLDALAAALAALPKLSTGTAQVTASLLGGATRDITIPITPPQPTATYSAGAWIAGGTGLLGQTILKGITGQTKTTVTVQIQNTGLAPIAASALSVQVLAIS